MLRPRHHGKHPPHGTAQADAVSAGHVAGQGQHGGRWGRASTRLGQVGRLSQGVQGLHLGHLQGAILWGRPPALAAHQGQAHHLRSRPRTLAQGGQVGGEARWASQHSLGSRPGP